jgi:NAD+ diphosphatase
MKILNLPFARSNVDRSAHVRVNESALATAWENATIIHFNGDGFLVESEHDGAPDSLKYLSSAQVTGLGERIFLGTHGGNNYFIYSSPDLIGAEHEYKTLRSIGHGLSDLHIGLAVHGQAVALWHAKNPYCPACGLPLDLALGGSVRRCANEHEQYPRTDPAIIVLIKDVKDRILIGRQAIWPENRFSTFAGFVEAGESFEQCVIREVFEESGVHVSNINYLGSQPWPFPQSLMIAFEATIDDPESARPDGEEIVEIRWYDRDTLYRDAMSGKVLLPPSVSVARAMIESWYQQDQSSRPPLPVAEIWR